MKPAQHPYNILAILTFAFVAFSVETDVYVPSFPEMMVAFHTTESRIQQILSLNFFGVCISSLVCGPLSDSFGRRRVLSIGTAIFTLSSLGCYFASNFEIMLFWRLIQGLGAGSILAVASTAIFDLYEPEKSAQLISILNSVVTVTMSFAPLVGSWLNLFFGWRSTFLFILLLAGFAWFLITAFLPESLPVEKRKAFKIKDILQTYGQLLLNRNFILSTVIWSMMFSTLIVYTASVSVLFIDHLEVSESFFGLYQASTMSAFCLFSFLASYLIGRFGQISIKKVGTVLFFAGCGAIFLVSLIAPKSPELISAAMAIIGAGTALAIVLYFTDSVVGIVSTGAALSLAQGLRLFFSSASTDISRLLFDGSIQSIANVILGMAAVCLICIGLLPKTVRTVNASSASHDAFII